MHQCLTNIYIKLFQLKNLSPRIYDNNLSLDNLASSYPEIAPCSVIIDLKSSCSL